MTEALDDFFSEAAEKMNEGLPEMVDDISRLDRVAYSNLTFTHYYTVVGLSDVEFSQEYTEEVLKDFFTSNACGDQQSRNAMQDGLMFACEFASESGEKLATVDITYADCGDS